MKLGSEPPSLTFIWRETDSERSLVHPSQYHPLPEGEQPRRLPWCPEKGPGLWSAPSELSPPPPAPAQPLKGVHAQSSSGTHRCGTLAPGQAPGSTRAHWVRLGFVRVVRPHPATPSLASSSFQLPQIHSPLTCPSVTSSVRPSFPKTQDQAF